jgi:hypothetical protein
MLYNKFVVLFEIDEALIVKRQNTNRMFFKIPFHTPVGARYPVHRAFLLSTTRYGPTTRWERGKEQCAGLSTGIYAPSMGK